MSIFLFWLFFLHFFKLCSSNHHNKKFMTTSRHLKAKWLRSFKTSSLLLTKSYKNLESRYCIFISNMKIIYLVWSWMALYAMTTNTYLFVCLNQIIYSDSSFVGSWSRSGKVYSIKYTRAGERQMVVPSKWQKVQRPWLHQKTYLQQTWREGKSSNITYKELHKILVVTPRLIRSNGVLFWSWIGHLIFIPHIILGINKRQALVTNISK